MGFELLREGSKDKEVVHSMKMPAGKAWHCPKEANEHNYLGGLLQRSGEPSQEAERSGRMSGQEG